MCSPSRRPERQAHPSASVWRACMKLWIPVALGALVVSSFAPTASAVDLCDAYGLCLPDPTPGNCLNGLVVRACGDVVYVCTFDYMGGGGTFPWDNLRFECYAVAR